MEKLLYEEVENLKTKIIDKLNGKAINFNGRFFISDGKKSSGIDFNQNADANHCLLYFLEDGQDEPIRLMMVRGWVI